MILKRFIVNTIWLAYSLQPMIKHNSCQAGTRPFLKGTLSQVKLFQQKGCLSYH
jgi:hypothetical protein